MSPPTTSSTCFSRALNSRSYEADTVRFHNHLRYCAALASFAIIMSFVSNADAQTEHVAVRPDASLNACSVDDVSSAQFTVYVVHTPTFGSTGANLSVVQSGGFTATLVSENIPFFHVGTFRDGVNVVYGECFFSTPFVIGTITYEGYGTSASCSTLDTSGNPDWAGGYTPYPISADCTFEWFPAPSETPLYVNPSSECPVPCVVGTESSTWGRVKSLYRR